MWPVRLVEGPSRETPLPDSISAFIDAQAKRSPVDYADLRVVVFNGTTKRSPEPSHTDVLLAISLQTATGLARPALGPPISISRAAAGTMRGRPATRSSWTWNMLHLARLLKDSGGMPSYGNSTRDWHLEEAEHPNPEYR